LIDGPNVVVVAGGNVVVAAGFEVVVTGAFVVVVLGGGGTVLTTVPNVVGAFTVVVVTVVGGVLPQLSGLPGNTWVPSSNRLLHQIPTLLFHWYTAPAPPHFPDEPFSNTLPVNVLFFPCVPYGFPDS
jgi:hypothetical protein